MKHICPNAGIMEICTGCYHSKEHEPRVAGLDDNGNEKTECQWRCGGACLDKFMPCKVILQPIKEAV